MLDYTLHKACGHAGPVDADLPHDCHACTDGTRATPWYGHPAARMWAGYEAALAEYGRSCVAAWVWRSGAILSHRSSRETFAGAAGQPIAPPWLGAERLHASHQANLLRKDHAHYIEHVDPALLPMSAADVAQYPYHWPVMHDGEHIGWWMKVPGAKSGHLDDGRKCRSYADAVRMLTEVVR